MNDRTWQKYPISDIWRGYFFADVIRGRGLNWIDGRSNRRSIGYINYGFINVGAHHRVGINYITNIACGPMDNTAYEEDLWGSIEDNFMGYELATPIINVANWCNINSVNLPVM